MTENKLMIGDWVRITRSQWHEGSIQKVLDVYENGSIRTKHISPVLKDSYEPVPLTQEILEANGFETKDYNNGFVDKLYTTHVDEGKSKEGVGKARIGVRRIRVTFYTDINKVNHIFCRVRGVSKRVIEGEIYFVHELQHALRFCGLNDIADNFIVDQ